MLTDVLRALEKERAISDVTIVSADPKILPIARRYGAKVSWERNRRGLNRALKTGIENVESKAKGAVLIVHADLPLLTPRDIKALIASSEKYEVTIAPCKEGTGTNALLLKRPNAMPLSFGRGSFRKHVSAARKEKLRYRVVRFEGIEFDVDEPRDLRILMRLPGKGATQCFLEKLSLERQSKAI